MSEENSVITLSSPVPETTSPPQAAPDGNPLQLILATGAFALCFAIFGSVSAMMPLLRKQISMSQLEVSIALAIPVLLGSLGRIPLGLLTDRLGGRKVFLAVLGFSVLPAVLMGFVQGYAALVGCGFLIGVALASFSVGIGMVSVWYPPQRQGTALGIYGAGNIGQSLAAYGAPVLAGAFGYAWGFWTFAILAALWLVVFYFLAEDAPRSGPVRGFADFLRPLRQPMSWVLSLYYFLTFGGFVAMAIYLPTLLTDPDLFGLTPSDAGLRTAGFVVLATLMRPVGGILADRIGGRRILVGVFAVTAVMALFLACPLMSTFTIGALGMAAAIGLGNGAVFKLVPESFPKAVGTVTGLVGAAGGLGGFFPPLVLGLIRQATGSFTGGFVLLALFSGVCLAVVLLVSGKRNEG